MDWYRCGLDPDREMLKLSTYLGHTRPENTYWYIGGDPGTAKARLRARGTEPRREGVAMRTYPLPVYVQRFFTERLATQLHASPNTVASYRDTFRLLLKYAADRLKREPTRSQVATWLVSDSGQPAPRTPEA